MPLLNAPRPAAPRAVELLTSYLVGQDEEGRWLAVEARGLASGVFRTRDDALRYARVETGCRVDEVSLAVGPIRLPVP